MHGFTQTTRGLAQYEISGKNKVVGTFMAILFFISVAAVHASGERSMRSLAQPEQARIEKLLTSEIQRVVNQQERLDGQGKYATAKVTLDVGSDFIVIDLSKSYLPTFYGAMFEDQFRELQVYATESLAGSIIVRGVTFLIEGKDVSHYFPEARARTPIGREKPTKTSQTVKGGPTQTVMISAMHGYYRHRKNNKWVLQRPEEFFGTYEDFITPPYADELLSAFVSRSTTASVFGLPRSTSSAIHIPSGHRWKDVAALYNLETLYPDNPEIWNIPAPTPLNYHRDYTADMNSRPYYANHIGASTAIHLHSNAGPSEARGTRAYYQAGRNQDLELASTVLCSMKEVIQAQDAYENWIVSSVPVAGNYAENREADMPSVIVEVAFHTNAQDAAALQDPIFRAASMKGLEKAHRLFSQDRDCEPFEIEVAPVTLPGNQLSTYDVEYSGNPTFNVTATVEVVYCPPPGGCNGGSQVFLPSESGSPLQVVFHCRNIDDPITMTFRTKLTDIDSVETEWVNHEVTCLAASPGAVSATPQSGVPGSG